MQRIQDMFINMEEVAEDAYKNTELLLSQYTKVMFRIEKNLVDIDYEMLSLIHISLTRICTRAVSCPAYSKTTGYS